MTGALELIREDPAPFLWLVSYLAIAGALVVAVGAAVLKWFRGVIGTDDLASYLYLERPRSLEVVRRHEFIEDPETGLLEGRWITEVRGG